MGDLVEAALPPNQVWGKKFVIYAALGVPRIDPRLWRLRVDGLVTKALEYTYDQLNTRPQNNLVRSFHCVTRWSVKDVAWEGLLIRDLLAPAGVSPDATWLMFHCADGYTAPVPLEDALKEDSILAFKLNGRTLSAEQGFPARPFIPGLYAWKSAKWVNRMELLADYSDGYWEMYGYHERAGVWEEERFKGHSGIPVKRKALGTA
jgi:DMSO/TMAO reductase YedYZ molybdopterin-dependent catalytic subunit